MIFRRLEFGIAVRLLLLFATLCAAVYSVFYLAALQVFSAGVIIAVQVWELARYVTRGNNELARFLLAVKNRDFSQRFSERHTNPAFRSLHASFNQINDTYRELQIEKEVQFQYMQTILQLIDTGIIAFDEASGEVEWLNEAFKSTLHVPHLKHIHALELRQDALYHTLLELEPGSSELLKLKVHQHQVQLLLSATAFKAGQRQLKLIAFKNVSNTVDQAETEAWQKLLRVMTHEIMNSVAPIASLADSMLRHLRQHRALAPEPDLPESDPVPELLQDTEEVLSVIQGRSEGLLRFAQVYRNLSKVNDLVLTTVFVQELFGSVSGLLRPQLEQVGIRLSVQLASPALTLQADPHLLEQVLINLILNAERAVKEQPQPAIVLSASLTTEGRLTMQVADNGSGIPEEIMDSIFIPFFSGHKDGSGIGLSLAKQIMSLHKGSIQVTSQASEGSVFTLLF